MVGCTADGHITGFRVLVAAGLSLCAALGAPTRARAASLIVISETRYVSAGPTGSLYSTPEEPAFHGYIGSCCAYAMQDSSLLDGVFSGTGDIATDGGGGDAHSVLDVSFTVSDLASFSLSGFITGGIHQGLFEDPLLPSRVLDGDFSFGGILVPAAHYRLLLLVEDSGSFGFSAGDWSFTLSVPKPALAWLALAALAAPLTRRRESLRRRRPLRAAPLSGR